MSESDKKWMKKLPYALRAMDDIEEYTKTVSQEDFLEDRMRMQAVERNLEIIGEAVNHLPEDIKQNYPEIPWSDIYGMRNILSHGYDVVDADTVWDTVSYDLKGLKEALYGIAKDIKE